MITSYCDCEHYKFQCACMFMCDQLIQFINKNVIQPSRWPGLIVTDSVLFERNSTFAMNSIHFTSPSVNMNSSVDVNR